MKGLRYQCPISQAKFMDKELCLKRRENPKNESCLACTGPIDLTTGKQLKLFSAEKSPEKTKERYCKQCGRSLHHQNLSDYCREHKPKPKQSKEHKICQAEGCVKVLRLDNKSGFCQKHKPILYTCNKIGCEVRLNSATYKKSPFCKDHRPGAKTCSYFGCSKKLIASNKSGYCHKHGHPEIKECSVPGCQTSLRSDNRTGMCAHHSRRKHIRVPESQPKKKETGTSKKQAYAEFVGHGLVGILGNDLKEVGDYIINSWMFDRGDYLKDIGLDVMTWRKRKNADG